MIVTPSRKSVSATTKASNEVLTNYLERMLKSNQQQNGTFDISSAIDRWKTPCSIVTVFGQD
ncbi:hypothetical protein MN186_01280 [Aliiroseovarius sp. N1F302]|uniref:hypothetical protein n=1 Tax=Aliiroseovarius sediminis TaxID=2925839 RepID=UPI001F5894DC|nr:hypothetical protein [Aliiroseovarius sediminis]MCI2393115.1 hypothetical protein [Aliiroseovarius sediminis]